ncbi:hypothetical protein LJC60_08200 [Ruminococcaceae bacterium OttesenSCG-928-D13]|nr:hypothetical protein [Ruminococcaceae bacterium OttesenSCG-928-D13]
MPNSKKPKHKKRNSTAKRPAAPKQPFDLYSYDDAKLLVKDYFEYQYGETFEDVFSRLGEASEKNPGLLKIDLNEKCKRPPDEQKWVDETLNILRAMKVAEVLGDESDENILNIKYLKYVELTTKSVVGKSTEIKPEGNDYEFFSTTIKRVWEKGSREEQETLETNMNLIAGYFGFSVMT